MSEFLIRHPQGFAFGFTPITQIGEKSHDTGIDFGILKLRPGEEKPLQSHLESAYLLIQGECLFSHDDQTKIVKRQSCFDDHPAAIHFAANHSGSIKALTDCEFAVFAVANTQDFATQIFDGDNLLENEKRGAGLLDNTACRLVRTIFDMRNRPQAKLVLGEVVTAPGRWSSYPPHHHPQPEIYHYRFTEPHGYGHAECGDEMFKVRQFDTYKILHNHDHAQAAAPGYGMYYIWVIRHLDQQPYTYPTFIEDHRWTKSADANRRVWKSNF